jgi:BCD family chlorophyll transporter-like MFS transporter
MLRKRFQLGLIHVAVAMTLVPINSTLNRVMIKELLIPATLVAILASLPYLFSPLQVAIGAYSDRHPIFGFRRTPYIAAGLILCAVGVIVSPQIAFLMAENWVLGVIIGILAFGAWGMGYNLASVSYLSLASELSTAKERGKTIATMWIMMIVSIIATAITLSWMIDPYTPEIMQNAFNVIGAAALIIGAVGLIRLEPRNRVSNESADNHSLREMIGVITSSPQVKLFFWYLLLLLSAILGQDVLLEPFGAEAFGMSVQDTTRITSIWGGAVLIALVAGAMLEKRVSRRSVAQIGNVGALIGFLAIVASGFVVSLVIFYLGVVLLGLGTGLSTVANLALMFDLTVPGKVGLFVGAWGMSNAFSRLAGSILGGVVRDAAVQITQNAVLGYVIVFGIESILLLIAILMLSRLNVEAFHRQVETPSPVERMALAE